MVSSVQRVDGPVGASVDGDGPTQPTAAGFDDTELGITRRRFGHDVLGPIMEWYLYRLDNHLQVVADKSALALFVARAGIRIDELYRAYLTQRGRVPSTNQRVFWSSRLLLCKGLARVAPADVDNQLRQNFRGRTIGDLLDGLFRHEPEVAADLDRDDTGLMLPVEQFSTASPEASLGTVNRRIVDAYLERYAELTVEQLAALGYERGRGVVMVDSGWQGSMHSLAVAGLAPSRVESLYLGAMSIDDDRPLPPGVTGLLVSSGEFSPDRPETALIHYRHLIESTLEANVESAESLERPIPAGPRSERFFRRRSSDRVETGPVVCGQQAIDVPDERRGLDALYLGVLEYVGSAGERPPAEMARRFERAATELSQHLLFPDLETVRALSAGSRSADFGRSGGMAVPLPVEDRAPGDSPYKRINDSLWPQGQAVVELDERSAAHVHRELCTNLTADGYFHGHAEDAGDANSATATVAVCTRTKNRPVLLERAARSVAEQTYSDVQWVVVNDGGDVGDVSRVLDSCAVDPGRITLVSHRESQGMEAASNAGISAVDSDFVVIHDDDDSWEPTFLERALGFLTSPAGVDYGGVVLGSTKVDEIIRGDEVEIVGREPYNAWLRQVNLPEMLSGNLFPPIAFVFRRSVYDDVGGFDETLPVLGDWDFNIRFLHRTDIAVLPEPLANYHHRVPGGSVSYGNSVTAGVSKHAEFRSRLINRYLRGSLGGAVSGLVLQAYIYGNLRTEIRRHGDGGSSGGTTVPLLDDLWLLAQWLVRSADSPMAGEFDDPDSALGDLLQQAIGDDFVLRTMTPPPNFDDAAYRRLYPDVDEAVRAGGFGSGFEHYIRHGRPEGRERADGA